MFICIADSCKNKIMNNPEYYTAIDLGAGSGRVIIGRFDNDEFNFEVIHRFSNSFKKALIINDGIPVCFLKK